MPTTLSQTFTIHDSRIGDVKRKLDALSKTAVKLGLPPFSVEEVSEHFTKRSDTGLMDRWVNLRFSGEQPVLSGWRFLAKLEHTDGGNIIKGYGADSLPDSYRSCPPNCDHCHVNRNRNSTFVVESIESGEQMQVGSSCVSDFTGGHQDPNMLLSLLNGIGEIRWDRADPFLDDDEDMGTGGRPYYGVDPQRALEVACAVIRRDGRYINAMDADMRMEVSTKDEVAYILLSGKIPLEKIITGPDKAQAKAVREWISNTGPDDSTYKHNLCVIAAMEAVDAKKHLGLLVSAPAAFNTAMKAQAKEDARPKIHIGSPKEKLDRREVIFDGSPSFPTQWGTTWNVLMTDVETGAQLKWTTSSPLAMQRGERYFISATIKAHSDYKGTAQTEIIRVSCPDLKFMDGMIATMGERNSDQIDAAAFNKAIKAGVKKINDPNVVNSEGLTPLTRAGMFADDSEPDKWMPMIDALLAKGADPLRHTHYHDTLRTPLDMAMRFGDGTTLLTERYLQHLQSQGVDMTTVDTLLSRNDGDMESRLHSFRESPKAPAILDLAERYQLPIQAAAYIVLEREVPETALYPDIDRATETDQGADEHLEENPLSQHADSIAFQDDTYEEPDTLEANPQFSFRLG